MTSRAYSLLAWPDVGRAADGGWGIIVPVGAVEQHGPHLPLDTDTYLANLIATAATEDHKLLVSPMIPFGYRSRPLSGGGEAFPGTLSLSGATFVRVFEELLSGLIRQGFRRLVIYSWHMENQNFVYEAAYTAAHQLQDVRTLVMESPFANLSDETMKLLFEGDFPGWPAEHASTLETSLMLHLRPDSVDMTKIADDRVASRPPYELIPPKPSMLTTSGVMARPSLATARKGEIAFAEICQGLTDAIDAEFPELTGRRGK
jgi:creatinine amidohydrolase